jgi:hypothetical protein
MGTYFMLQIHIIFPVQYLGITNVFFFLYKKTQ